MIAKNNHVLIVDLKNHRINTNYVLITYLESYLNVITTLLWFYYNIIYTTLIKKFPEFIQKIQNTSFIHQK